MAKLCIDAIPDAALNYIKTNGSRLCLCSAQPTTYTEAITTYKLADVDIDSGDYTGPADGDVSGRKLTVNEQADVTIDATGTATHLAIVYVTGTALLYVTTITSQALVATNLVTIPSWDIEFRDPA